jgi:protein transport protein SEC23
MTTPVSEKPIGIGGTNTWRIPSTSTTSTVCIFYEIAGQYKTQEEMTAAANANQQFFLQFQSQFTLPSGETRLRVTTVTRKWSDGMHVGELIGGFDQEAAAVVTARYVGWKMEMEEDFDATR